MALMAGSGPFGRTPAGTFNFTVDAPAHQLYLEPTPRRLRVVTGERVIADTTDAMVLHETGLMPVYYVPLADVRQDVLEATNHHTHCPFKGDASYWSVRVGDEVRENAVWTYPEPLDGAPPLAGLVAFYPDAVDAWYEESEQLTAHPRDPYHRVDVVPSDRHVTVRVGDRVVAESRRPTMVFETSLPARTYLPADDVDLDQLEPSDTRSVCPYKGRTTRYFSIRTDDGLREDAVWVYDEPLPEAAGLAGLLAFDDDQVTIDVEVDRFTL
jgi:uncharacterized protein (DUF427 family)